MKQLNPALIKIVRAAFKGKKLEKLDASLAIINESLAQGAWVKRGSVKADSGFYQGICKASLDRGWRDSLEYGTKQYKEMDCAFPVEMMLHYGQSFSKERARNSGSAENVFATGVKVLREHGDLKLSDEVIKAWRDLCEEKEQAKKVLNEARPLPVVTAIGLSPKVTKTFKEMNLDIDLPTIKPAKVVKRTCPEVDSKGKPVIDEKTGLQKILVWYEIEWTKGIKHGKSRFSGHNGQCEACGKYIPSGMFVPIEAECKKNGLISLWLGCDCSKNIFGIKDVGVERKQK